MRLLSAVRRGGVALLFALALLVGILLGVLAPAVGDVLGATTDPLILLLLGALLLTVPVPGAEALRRAPRVVGVVLGLNFLAIPLIAGVLTLLVPDDTLRVGVLLYLLAPCTDWFLGFTRIAGGDTATGAALIPIQLPLQLALYPLWVAVFVGINPGSALGTALPTLVQWFLFPALAALGARLLLRGRAPLRTRVLGAVECAIPLLIAAVIVAIFAAHARVILADPAAFAGVLLVVFLFFAVGYLLAEGASRAFRLRAAEQALVSMTVSARNAPLMLALTAVALPGQPLILAAIVFGMLLEFPHLTVLARLLSRRTTASPPATAGRGSVSPRGAAVVEGRSR